MERLVPKLFFHLDQLLSNHWELKPLREVAPLSNGYSFSKDHHDDSSDYVMVTISSLKNRRYLDTSASNKVIVPKNISSHQKLKPGDVLIAMSGATVGKIGQVDIPNGLLNQRVGLLKPTSCLNKNFLFYSLEAMDFEKKIKQNAAGGAQPNIGKVEIENFLIPIPSLPEQEKIAGFLSALDSRIELQEKKISLLKEQKKGYVQRIFNRELRFQDDNGHPYPEWEEKTLSELVKAYQPKTISQAEFTQTGYPVYGANGRIGYYSEYNHIEGQVLVSCRGENSGKINQSHEPAWITGNSMVVAPFDEKVLSKSFLYHLLDNANLKKIVSGSGQPQITRIPLVNLKFNFPFLPEQEKIAKFLSALDEKISLEEQKLAKYMVEKKGYMQRIFG